MLIKLIALSGVHALSSAAIRLPSENCPDLSTVKKLEGSDPPAKDSITRLVAYLHFLRQAKKCKSRMLKLGCVGRVNPLATGIEQLRGSYVSEVKKQSQSFPELTIGKDWNRKSVKDLKNEFEEVRGSLSKIDPNWSKQHPGALQALSRLVKLSGALQEFDTSESAQGTSVVAQDIDYLSGSQLEFIKLAQKEDTLSRV